MPIEWYSRQRSDKAKNTMTTQPVSSGELGNLIAIFIAHTAKISIDTVDMRRTLTSYGLDSVAMLQLAITIGNRIGREVEVEELYQDATVEDLTHIISGHQC